MFEDQSGSSEPQQPTEQVEQSHEQPQEQDYRSIKHKVKPDGEELEIAYDELINGYQKGVSSQKRYEEASRLRKEVDYFLDDLQGGKWDALSNFMPEDKIMEMAENYLRKKIEWEELPDHEKERIRSKREIDEYKSKISDYETKEYQNKYNQINEEVSTQVESDIVDAIEYIKQSYGDIKVTPELIENVARLMLNDEEDAIDARKAAEISFKRSRNQFNEYLKSLKPSDLKNNLTKAQLKALMEDDLNEAMTQFEEPKRQVKRSTEKKSQTKLESLDDWFTTIQKRIGA